MYKENRLKNMRIFLVITIDTEIDKSPSWEVSTNETFLSVLEGIPKKLSPLFNRFQAKPTYLLSPEVIENPECVNVLKNINNCELGTHLHGELIEPQRVTYKLSNKRTSAMQSSLPKGIEYQKLKNLTNLFTKKFGHPPTSFRAGRFAAGNNTITLLEELGYLVDSSITPGVDWDLPEGRANFLGATEQPYFPSKEDLLERGNSKVLEVPISIVTLILPTLRNYFYALTKKVKVPKIVNRVANKAINVIFPTYWLRPSFQSSNEMVKVIKGLIKKYCANDVIVLNMMFHSMEVIPNASPYTKTEKECQAFLREIQTVLEYCVANNFNFVTLSELYPLFLPKVNKMKIVFLTQFYPPKWVGGTEIASQNIVEELRKKHEVDIITSQNSIPKLKVFLYLKSTLKKLRKNNYDVIHCQSTIPAIAAYLSRKPYVVYCRGSDIYLAKGWRKIINKVVLKNARKIIALTKDMQKKIKEDYGFGSTVISNGIDISKYKLNRQKLRKEFGIKEHEFIILYVGTLKKVKGIEYLIKAFKDIENKNKNIKLWIVGDGAEKENLKNLAKKLKLKNIKFWGWKDNKEIPKYAKASDLFVLPSLSEGFPVSILEAMAGGLPIIATKVGGVPEIVKNGKNGFLVKSKDSKKIEEKILLKIKNQKLREKISKNNLIEVKKYSWQKVAKQLERVYKEI